eukprot:Nitzschia sp. Nitz4//scaffold70_size99833//28238//30363//NITZ4_004591-RA/size99833-processed-gene-0.7-mRNA-1//1//CDS//3329557123//1103//frame0
MGASPSKDTIEEETTTYNNQDQSPDLRKSHKKKSKSKYSDKMYHDIAEEKKEEPVSAVSATPRSSHKYREFNNKSHSDKLKSSESRDDSRQHALISDDQVHVNLAMADLMAYLQVVANNSNNLPLTRRDDPELGRMVTNLTSEEYARKSAAFIPADVRVIGGSFTKYGRVWDLPTGEEYNAQDGAQEPGRSYGGACSNAMLKVLYDAANEAADAAQGAHAADALFDDDDDEDATIGPAFARASTFASIDMNDHFNPSTISWVSLLRKMKAEIKDIEYAQVPMLTSTRKFDLNQPFSLVPDSFDPTTGKRRSLLIGCNYSHLSGAQLKASHDDVRSMKDYIVNVHGFPESEDMMTILLDDDEHKHPTFLNITEAFKTLSEESQPGDAVFIHFSGHGGRVLDACDDAEAESYAEVIVPSDYNVCGLVRDTLIFKTLLAPMRYGVTVTVLVDACDTGMVLDLPYSWSTRSDRTGSTVKLTQNDDFSFVRFLKVVKTLYESSTFTQLGKTVGSALNPGVAPRDGEETDDGTYSYTDKESEFSHPDDEDNMRLQIRDNGTALVDAFLGCTSPRAEEETPKKSKKENDQLTLDSRSGPSFFEQMINCTLGAEVDEADDISEADTKSAERSYSEPDDSTFDSYDDSYVKKKRSSRRGRSRRRRN